MKYVVYFWAAFNLVILATSESDETTTESDDWPFPMARFWNTCSRYTNHHLAQGCKAQRNATQEESLIFEERITLKKAIFVQDNIIKVMYPQKEQGNKTLTCVKVRNNIGNFCGGCPSILNGGVGSKNVVIQLTPQRFQGMDFTIEIYGK